MKPQDRYLAELRERLTLAKAAQDELQVRVLESLILLEEGR